MIFQARPWQKKCMENMRSAFNVRRDFTVVATPGGGKTKLALAFASELIRAGVITHVHVVAPSTALRIHWDREAQAFGLRLVRRANNTLRNHNLPFDIIGVAATYAQVASDADAHAASIENAHGKALVILDECHHSGDRRAWGEAVKLAFEEARFRLHLSGTPFRNDGNVIPWVSMGPDGAVLAHGEHGYSYSYSEAMKDDVCRPVAFHRHDIDLKYTVKGRVYEVSFGDDITKDGESARLRAALDAEGALIREMVRSADRDITDLRTRGGRFADAAGILVAMDQAHAYECAKIVREISGEEPSVIVSDSDTADDDLSAFHEGMGRWIVSVRMVSEGVDIPRLMTAVYATNIVSELFFRQFIGRVVRVRHRGLRETAKVYLPADDRLADLAGRIESDVRTFVRDNAESYPEMARHVEGQGGGGSSVKVVSMTCKDSDVIIGGWIFTHQEIEDVKAFLWLYPEASAYSLEQLALHLARARDEDGKDVGYKGGRRYVRDAAE